jgi:probable rRNA maturation factor
MSRPTILNRQRRYKIPLRLGEFADNLAQHLDVGQRDFTVVLTSDAAIQRLNRDFRRRNTPTDVLSFPSELPPAADGLDNPYIGDMIVSVETARRQALHRRHSLERELRILIIHGFLHLLGYDHERDHGTMRRKELKLQRELL